MPSPATLARLAFQAGASFALYAAALVLATVLQSNHDAVVTADRYPLVVAAEQLRSERQLTVRQVERALRGADQRRRADTTALTTRLPRWPTRWIVWRWR